MDSYPPSRPIYSFYPRGADRSRTFPRGKEVEYFNKKYSDGCVFAILLQPFGPALPCSSFLMIRMINMVAFERCACCQVRCGGRGSQFRGDAGTGTTCRPRKVRDWKVNRQHANSSLSVCNHEHIYLNACARKRFRVNMIRKAAEVHRRVRDYARKELLVRMTPPYLAAAVYTSHHPLDSYR